MRDVTVAVNLARMVPAAFISGMAMLMPVPSER